jgi:hypothetical protein
MIINGSHVDKFFPSVFPAGCFYLKRNKLILTTEIHTIESRKLVVKIGINS